MCARHARRWPPASRLLHSAPRGVGWGVCGAARGGVWRAVHEVGCAGHDGLKHGFGKYTMPHGVVYVGEFEVCVGEGGAFGLFSRWRRPGSDTAVASR